MKKALKDTRDFVAIILLSVVAAGVGAYILSNQRVRPPWAEKPFSLKAEFTTAQAVTPGQGQTLRVSGVRIGDISGVELKDGNAVVEFDVDPEYKNMIHTDAKALLRPKTGLKDMFVELDPGSQKAPRAKEGWTVPVANTLPDVNPDEIFSALDGDTRDYLKLLVNGAGKGLEGRDGDLREVFRRFEPTHRDLAKVTSAVATRRTELRRVINSLNRLNGELAGKDDDLAELVDSSASVFRAFASEDTNISQTIDELPSALRETTTTLRKLETFANVLRPAATNLVPAAKALDEANTAVRPFAREAAPIIADDIRPFVREARPLVRDLLPASQNLAKVTPDLTRSFKVLNSFFNLLGFNQNGREGPENAKRDEGYLFWLAWLQHNGAAVFQSADAHGVLRPVAPVGTCTSIRAGLGEEFSGQVPPAGAAFLLGLTGVLTDRRVCGPLAEGDGASPLEALGPLLGNITGLPGGALGRSLTDKKPGALKPAASKGDAAADDAGDAAGAAADAIAATSGPNGSGALVQKQAPTFGRLLTMVGFALSCFGLLLFLWLSFGGTVPLKPKGYRFTVAVPEASQLADFADVRTAGVSIGKVRGTELDAKGNATLATIELDRRFSPLRADAKAILRQKTLLGETYLELTPGTKNAPEIPENGELASARVAKTVELDELFEAFDAPTRASFRSWQQDAAKAIDGRGQDFNDALGNLPDFAEDAVSLLGVLNSQDEAVRRLFRNTGVVFEALTENEDQLRNLIVNSGKVFDATSSERESLAETFQIFPTFLDESRTTLARLERFSADTRPLIRDLRPVARDLRPTLRDVRAFAPDLRNFLLDLDPLITASKTGLPALRDTLRGLRPMLTQLDPFLAQLNPILRWLEYHQHSTADFIANGGGALSDTVETDAGDDGNGHYLRQFGPAGTESIATFPNRLKTNRGNAYPDPVSLQGPLRGQNNITPSFDCKNIGGERKSTRTMDPDGPSCYLKPLLDGPYPKIGADDNSKRPDPTP